MKTKPALLLFDEFSLYLPILNRFRKKKEKQQRRYLFRKEITYMRFRSVKRTSINL